MAGEALLSTLQRVCRALQELPVAAALMGGLAVAAWRHLRNTRDVDLLVAVPAAGEQELLRRLIERGFRPSRNPPFVTLDGSRFLQLTFEPPEKSVTVHVDLLLADSEFHRTALARSVATEVAGLEEPIGLLTCEDLILLKLIAGRLIDRSDAAHLLRLNGAVLDNAYLKEGIEQLGLAASFAEIRQEAFPEERTS